MIISYRGLVLLISYKIIYFQLDNDGTFCELKGSYCDKDYSRNTSGLENKGTTFKNDFENCDLYNDYYDNVFNNYFLYFLNDNNFNFLNNDLDCLFLILSSFLVLSCFVVSSFLVLGLLLKGLFSFLLDRKGGD